MYASNLCNAQVVARRFRPTQLGAMITVCDDAGACRSVEAPDPGEAARRRRRTYWLLGGLAVLSVGVFGASILIYGK